VTEARVEKTYADGLGAGDFFAQAEMFLADAETPSLRAESQAILLHNAAICACDAILQAVGLRITSGDGAHALRLETTREQVGASADELFERLDASRERRNEASYRAGFVPQASLADAREATTKLIELARRLVAN
jgi:hypothetical protein